MSIYIQIATIEDHNLMDTVLSAVLSASDPDSIHIGVAAAVGDEFFAREVAPLRSIVGVSARQYDPATEWGLGRGRVNSRFAYDGQDYILQVDAHTKFYQGWDSYLLRAYELAAAESQNDKTLMTGYLGRHHEVGGALREIDRWTGYPLYSTTSVVPNVKLRGVAVIKISDFPDDQIGSKTHRFYPSNRVCGNFCMGNTAWADYHGWSGEEVFWEEETTPAISLLDRGFSLVFPNLPMPLTHRYWNDDTQRQTMDDIFERTSDITNAANAHIDKFVKNNYDACKRYADYSGYDLTTDTTSGIVIPKGY